MAISVLLGRYGLALCDLSPAPDRSRNRSHGPNWHRNNTQTNRSLVTTQRRQVDE